eukprot:SAG31_NODE_18_length_35375_cov_22.525315_27_plen_795_part_00
MVNEKTHGVNALFFFRVRVSYMEIYNEKVRDLLNPATAGEELKVREDPKTGFYVECQEVAVTNDDQIYAMLDAGNELRTVGATNMNAQSSRSHAIFRLVIESSPKEGVEQEGTAEENAFRSSYLNLVDLAGSERTKDTGAAGARLKEAGNINLSLSCLSNIIRALADASMKKGKAKSKVHLPFRNSKLTQILQPSLGGNSRTAFVCTVTLAARFYEDTKSTLAFADRAKKVTNKPKKNILVNEKAMLQEAQDEIAQLKRALALAENGTTLPGDMTAAGGNDVETDTMEHQTLVNKIKFLESMMIGAGGAQQLDIMHEMWTPEMGSSAFDSNEAAKLLKEAEIKRVEEFRTVQRKEIEKVWEEVDADGSGTLDPDELKDVFAKMGQSDVDVPSVLAEIDDDGNGEVDFNEFFEWWCTRTVADRERLKGTATALDGPSSTRIAKLKVRLKIAARLCGAVSANRAKDRTVSAAQLIKGMSGIGMGPTAGKAAESREAKRKVEALRKELYAAKDEIKRKDADLEQQAARFDAQAGELSALRAKLENAEEAATNSAEGRAAADRDAVQLGNKVADLEAELSNVHAALAVSQAHAEELEQKTDQQRVAAGLEVAQSNQAAATLRSQLSSRDATIVTLSGKIATLEAEVAELQHAIVELAVDERVKETERLRIDLANRKAQADEQIEQLRQNVVSARYMQTLYSTTKPGLIEHDSTNMVSSHVSASSFSTNSPRVGSRSNADIPFSPTSPHATSLRRKAARAWSTDATSTLRSEADMSAATGADAAKEMMALLGLPQNSNA